MKKLLALALLLAVVCMLSGCCLIHEWQDATCATQRTCVKCGETEGELLPHTWQDATCEAPKTCSECGATEGEALGHDWADPDCTTRKICRVCNAASGIPLGHHWLEATCEAPKTCDRCALTEGEPIEHSWIAGNSETPDICENCQLMKPMDKPQNGERFIGKYTGGSSQITIRSSSSNCCYVKLKDQNGKDVVSFFVQESSTATCPVPRGYYYVYFAYGTDWYGPEYIFGPDTVYTKDDELSDFYNYTWEYTLYPTTGGNFSETPVDESEF